LNIILCTGYFATSLEWNFLYLAFIIQIQTNTIEIACDATACYVSSSVQKQPVILE
jgi:hypothetical protein